MGAPIISVLRKMADEEIIANHDRIAASTSPELARRDQAKQTEMMLALTKTMAGQTEAMLGYTRWITWLTAAVTLATIVSVAVVAFGR
jgi:hypothetical protein